MGADFRRRESRTLARGRRWRAAADLPRNRLLGKEGERTEGGNENDKQTTVREVALHRELRGAHGREERRFAGMLIAAV